MFEAEEISAQRAAEAAAARLRVFKAREESYRNSCFLTLGRLPRTDLLSVKSVLPARGSALT